MIHSCFARWAPLVAALVALALAAGGCSTTNVPTGALEPVDRVWLEVFERSDVAPWVEYVEATCGTGIAVWNAAARTTYCLGGQALSETWVQVAIWPGATLRDAVLAGRVAHELTHAWLFRLGVEDGDARHVGPEWEGNAGGLVLRARDALVAYAGGGL